MFVLAPLIYKAVIVYHCVSALCVVARKLKLSVPVGAAKSTLVKKVDLCEAFDLLFPTFSGDS